MTILHPTADRIAEMAKSNHIWLNAFRCLNPTDAFKIDLANEILAMLDKPENLIDEGILGGQQLYLSVNKS